MALLWSSAVLFRDLTSCLLWGCLLCSNLERSIALQLPRGYPGQTFEKDRSKMWNWDRVKHVPDQVNGPREEEEIRFESMKLSEVAQTKQDPIFETAPGSIVTSEHFQYGAVPEFNPDYIDAEIWAVEEEVKPKLDHFDGPLENDLVDQNGREVESFINEYFKYQYQDIPLSHITEAPRKIRFKPTLKAIIPTEAVIGDVAPLSERVSNNYPEELPIERLPGYTPRPKYKRKHNPRRGNGRFRKPIRRMNGGFAPPNEPQPLTDSVANFLETILPAFVTLGSILGFGLGAMTFEDQPANSINFNPRFQVSGTNITIDYLESE